MTAWLVYVAALAIFGLAVAALEPLSKRLWGTGEEEPPTAPRGRQGK